MTLNHNIKAVAEQLQSNLYDPPVRRLAEKLGDAVMRDMDPVPLLIEILLSNDEWASIRVLDLLAELNDERVLAALLQVLAYETHQQPLDMELERLLEQNQLRGAVAGAEHAGRDVMDMRAGSITALGRLGHPGAVQGLARVLNDDRERSEMKNAACLALEQIGTAEALEAIQEWKANRKEPPVKKFSL